MSRVELLQTVWGAPADAANELETRTVDMTIANLRQKIEVDPAAPRIIVTIKGAPLSTPASMGQMRSVAS